jgi:hypothetical protein
MAGWLGLAGVVVTGPGDLAPALAESLGQAMTSSGSAS